MQAYFQHRVPIPSLFFFYREIVNHLKGNWRVKPQLLQATVLPLILIITASPLFCLEKTPAFVSITRQVLETPFAARTADFNEDGFADVAVGNDLRGVGYITILLGSGQGSFPLKTYVPLSGNMVRDLMIDDFNNDGHWDICSVLQLSERISLVLGDGMGHFTEASVIETYGMPEYLTTGDFNEDGFPDLALSHWTTGDMTVFMNDGAGGFLCEEIYDVGGAPRELDVSDFNEDGHVDIAVATMAFNEVYVFFGDGTGIFSTHEQIYVDYDAYVVKADDFDGDGHDDIAAGTKHSFVLLRGDGEGCFTRSFERRIFDPHAIITGDFNEDGLLDAGVAMTAENLFEVYIGDGNAGFLEETVCYNLPGGPRSLARADFNEDGHADLVSANEYSNDLTTFLNQVDLLHVTTEPVEGLFERGGEITFNFCIENPQDSLVSTHVWFTLRHENKETLIDPDLLDCGGNPFDLSLSPGCQGDYSVTLQIPCDLDEGAYRFYVNIGDLGYSPDEEWPSEGEGGAMTPGRMTPIVLSSGKISFHVVEGESEGEEEEGEP
jgi:hypothetical protein